MDPDVLSFEEQFEDAFCAIYAENGLNTNKRRSGTKVATPFVDVLFELQDTLEHMVPLANGAKEYDCYTGRLMVAVVTQRTTTEGSHAALIRDLRWIMLNRNLTFNHALYEVFDVRPMGSSYAITDGLDVTELAFDIVFRIKQSAFT